MPKYKNGEHISLHWEDVQEYEVVKGHVTDVHFMSEMKKYYGEDVPNICKIVHAYGRWGVGRMDGEATQMFFKHNERGRGKFPCTFGHFSA